jgi:RsiW-degrading membrane proteinase PrsW (M82 family)
MKLQLMLESGTLAGRVFELETGFLTIGRAETCSVRFDPLTERIASKQHAFIESRPDGFYLTDNNSTNGTIVNGQSISSIKLNAGDRIQFGANGSTAVVQIDSPTSVASLPTEAVQQNYRDFEIQQFNNVASQEPASLQASLHNFGLGSMSSAQPEPSKTGRYIGIGITLFVLVLCGLVVTLLLTASLSPSEDRAITINAEGVIIAILASFVAFIPAVLYILPIVWLDRYDPEPFWLLALAFAWGALVAVIVSFIVNTVIGQGTVYFAFNMGYTMQEALEIGESVGAVVSAPIFEEASKGLGLLILLVFYRRYFDDILDGLVFAGVIALGFATVENVLYYGRALGAGGVGGVALLFVLRGIMSPFAHVTFTAMTGIGCGIARESHKNVVRFLMPIVGYIAAVVLHAIWNGMAVIGGFGGFVVGYIVLEIPFFLIFVGFSIYIMRRQNKILNEMLAIDIARGLIPAEHVRIATSAFSSSGWLIGGIFNGKYKSRSKYIRAIGKLGLSYWHIQRATAAQGHTGSFQQNPILRDEVLKWRDQV